MTFVSNKSLETTVCMYDLVTRVDEYESLELFSTFIGSRYSRCYTLDG